MATATDTDRPAPGALALVQEFLNTQVTAPTSEELALAEEMRRHAASGMSQATIASRYGVSQQLVSAVLRGKRLTGPSELHLGSQEAAADWLRSHGWLPEGQVVAFEERERLLDAHEGLLAMALANNGETLDVAAAERLAEAARPVALRLRIGEDGSVVLEPPAQGVDAAIGTFLVAVHEAQSLGTWQRLKACPADHCQHVFYDSSRNRTATWCSMAICGNRTKVRAYQQRRRADSRV